MPWPTSNHESPDVNLTIPDVAAPHYLWAFLMADGHVFREGDYRAVRDHLQTAVAAFSHRRTGGQAPDPDISPQRLRTWKSAFEEMGLLTVDDEGALRATRFGRAVIDGWLSVDERLQNHNQRIARIGAEVANRVLLAKPDRTGNPPEGVPADSNLLPIRAIWRAFRSLGNRLHWQDINRVLGHVYYEDDVQQAIDTIDTFRQRHGGVYEDRFLEELGQPLTLDPRHITPWFNKAGMGGLLIPSDMDAAGFRVLPEASLLIVDELLAGPVPHPPGPAFRDRGAYVRYLMEPVERAHRPVLNDRDRELIEGILAAVRSHGSTKFIVLSGLPGTGKTRAAEIVADMLTDGDPLRLKSIQFHESTSYEDFMEGFVPRGDGQGFERRSKTFRLINQRALDFPEKKHVLLIEEFTRANTHLVLGELLTFIEHRGRGFTLPLSQEEISVAPNLVVLATMNPRDRSALSLDDAIVRRMHRIQVPSSNQSIHDMLTGTLPVPELERLAEWFNANIATLPFGHGVFAGAESVDKLRSIWEGTVKPLLTDPLGRIREAYQAAHDSFPFQ